MEGYITIKQAASYEYEEKKSVFIADAAPVSCEAEALRFIEGIKKRYPDARHHVYAYVLRENSIMRFSDDREPQGTAGMPVLDVIRKNGCTDTVIVVTRYFGGTLLGTGGLVRAYTAAALGALSSAEIITYDIYTTLEIKVSYSDYQRLGAPLTELGFRTLDTLYSDLVAVSGSVKSALLSELEKRVVELTSGRAEITVIGEKFEY